MSTSNEKSWLQKPEGKTGAIIATLLLGAGGWGLFKILPAIIVLLENTIYAMTLAGAISLALFIVSDKRVRALAAYGWKSLMRAITGLIVEIDPIGILRGYLEDLKESLSNMDKSISDLVGQITKLKNQIAQNEERRQKSLKLMAQAKGKEEHKNVFLLQSRQAGRLEGSSLTLQGLLNKMEKLKRVLSKTREVSVFMIQDIEGEVEVKSQERAALKAGYSAFTAAKKIIAGESDQKELFDQAMEKLTDDYAMKMGEIENFMEISDGFIKGVDLENSIYELEAINQLDEWEKKSGNLLMFDGNNKYRVSNDDASDDELVAAALEEENREERTSFSNLFENK